MNKIEHLGIAVRDLSKAQELFNLLLGKESYKVESVEREKVNTLFYQLGESKIELLESSDPDGTIAKFIDKRGEGFHHVAIAVDDIRAEMQRLKNAGFELLNDEPKPGADNKIICFLHPKSTGGLLVELCQEK
ncbi:MAG TPA: methylmalonyl-CoA epimerase [Flavobacteriales bacterium]|nr:methylmalonyl-CoA epimerase [Flavobacteriales bacterium]HPH82756.1 methylmalonyl-CoA epimerase [Flavobacteriales bacterium]